MMTARNHYLISRLLILLIAVSWLLSSCGGHGTGLATGDETADTFYGDITMDDLAAAGDALPFPDEYENPGPPAAPRDLSAIEDQTRVGKDAFRKHVNATVDGNHMQLISTAGEICWAMYRFNYLSDMDEPQSISVEFAAPLPDEYYLGFADYAGGVWVWHHCTGTTTSTSETDQTAIPAALDLVADNGALTVAIVVWGETTETIYSVKLTSDVNQNAPLAGLVIDPYRINRPADATLDASSSTDRDGGGIVSYEWDWEGDGTFDHTGANAVETINYAACGAYHPVVRVTDGDGNMDIASGLLVVQGWSHTWGSGGNDANQDIQVGPDGGLYLVGQYNVADSDYDILISHYSGYGELVWRYAWGGPEGDYGSRIGFDEEGNIWVVGSTSSFGAPGLDVLIIKLDPDGNVLFSKIWGSDSSDTANAMLFDANGIMHVTGKTSGFSADTLGDMVYLLVAQDGTIQSQKMWDATSNSDQSFDMTRDGEGNIYVCGCVNYSTNTESSALLMKLGSSLNTIWAKAINHSTLSLSANGIDLDLSGGIYMTGARTGWLVKSNLVLINVNSDGSLDWCKIRQDGQEDVGFDVMAIGGWFGATRVVVSGQCYDDNFNALLLETNGFGECQWQKSWRAGPHTYGYALARGGYGATYLGGTALRANGDWNNESEVWADEPATLTDISGTFENIVGTEEMVSGTRYTPDGVVDTGAGGREALAGGWFTEDW